MKQNYTILPKEEKTDKERLILFGFKETKLNKYIKFIGNTNGFLEQEINIEKYGYSCFRIVSTKYSNEKIEYFTDKLSKAMIWCGSGIYK